MAVVLCRATCGKRLVRYEQKRTFWGLVGIVRRHVDSGEIDTPYLYEFMRLKGTFTSVIMGESV